MGPVLFGARKNFSPKYSVPKREILQNTPSPKEKKEEKLMKVIIAAAGTAGHINPALSIANKIKQEQKDSEIIFIRNNKRIRK